MPVKDKTFEELAKAVADVAEKLKSARSDLSRSQRDVERANDAIDRHRRELAEAKKALNLALEKIAPTE